MIVQKRVGMNDSPKIRNLHIVAANPICELLHLDDVRWWARAKAGTTIHAVPYLVFHSLQLQVMLLSRRTCLAHKDGCVSTPQMAGVSPNWAHLKVHCHLFQEQ